jgi:S-formylglutathione hydrolase FrmB
VTAQSAAFIAGLSMGGFGALRLGAKYPQRFAGVSGHSSITHFAQMSKFVEEPLAAYGPPPEDEQSVLHWMLANRDRLPPIRFDCGTEDLLIEENRLLHRELDARGVPHTYEEFPGGHEWPYWERHIADTLRFFGRCLGDKSVTVAKHPPSVRR